LVGANTSGRPGELRPAPIRGYLVCRREGGSLHPSASANLLTEPNTGVTGTGPGKHRVPFLGWSTGYLNSDLILVAM